MTLYEEKYRIESARLRAWDYRSRGWYFVTICTHKKACIFGHVLNGEMKLNRLGRIVNEDLASLYRHYENIYIDSHVVMPNHVHAIVAIEGEHHFSPRTDKASDREVSNAFVSPRSGSLAAIVRSYKAGVTFKAREIGLQHTIWQTRFHDHLLREDKVISAVREYIENNPANWGFDPNNPFFDRRPSLR